MTQPANSQQSGSRECSSAISRPSIDHTLLSPSGRASKRARDAALKREAARLFPPGYFDAPTKSAQQIASEKAATLRRSAANLRDLAARGMSARKFLREAAKLEARADELERSNA